MEVAHANFSKVTRVVYPQLAIVPAAIRKGREEVGRTFIKVCSVVVLTTSQTATAWMLAVLANAAVAVGDVASELSCVA